MKRHHTEEGHRANHREPRDDSDETRIGKRITPMSNGCWAFDGNLDRYASVYPAGKQMRAHRWVYSVLVGEVDDDEHLHHECLNPGCVNPSHLVPLSPTEHARRHARMRRAS